MHLKIKNILKSKGVFHEKWKQPINLGTIPIFGDIRSKGLAGAENRRNATNGSGLQRTTTN